VVPEDGSVNLDAGKVVIDSHEGTVIFESGPHHDYTEGEVDLCTLLA
jgi:hypothetical protein